MQKQLDVADEAFGKDQPDDASFDSGSDDSHAGIAIPVMK
jgi:hypothetical protein